MNTQPKITPEMIRLYDEYTHVTLDRRGFLAKLTQLAGSSAAAMAVLAMLENDYAKAALVPADDPRLKAETVTFKGVDGTITGYLVKPANAAAKLPGVVVVHENRGLNPHIQDVARRVALDGFLALAVDLLSPAGGTPSDEDKARDMIAALDMNKAVGNAVAAVAYLKSRPDSNGKVGAVGFCWGGGMVNAMAVNAPDLAAAVAYYGRQPDPKDVPRIKAKLLLHYAGKDERINAGIAAYEAAFKAADIPYTLYMYDGVDHAFNNDTNAARYDKAAADLAFGRTIDFLKKALG
jgi:carboxymethylenebutenolidase